MDSIKNLLQHKADDIDLSKGDDLQIIQIELDRLFDQGTARASAITNRNHLIITTTNAANMTTIRYSQLQIMKAISNQTKAKIENIIVKLS